MRRLRLIYLMMTLTLFVTITANADGAELNTWHIIERCLSEPIEPDDGWSFGGEILMGGWAGIHAVSTKFSTPYVLYWGRYLARSPDGKWILTQEVDSWHEQLPGPGPLGRTHWNFGDIKATNTSTNEVITFQWEAKITMSSRPRLSLPAGPIWIDNHRFASFYGIWASETKIGDIENGKITDWKGIRFEDSELSLSPDLTRSVSFGKLYDLSDNRLLQEDLVGTDWDSLISLWTQDSSMFADVITDRSNNTVELTLFDRDGNIVAAPFRIEGGRIHPLEWSLDNNYLAFSVSASGQKSYILDMQDEVVYDLCTSNAGGFAWSPDGTRFATILGREQAPVVVVDMNTLQPYIIAYHTGAVFLWRATN